MKALIACAALLCASATQSGLPAVSHPEIVQVNCLVGSGTAFRVGRNTLVSANHVTSLAACFIGDERVNVVNVSGDFSEVESANSAARWLQVDCGGYVAGKKYRAIGFARGLPTLTEVDLTATGETVGELSILSGVFTVVPGQSGGPILDADTGKVVGLVNRYNMESGLSASIALRDTPLCSRS
jgi:hypothetical protein